MINNTYIFDKDFYVNFYPDIKNGVLNESIDPYHHYETHGKIEKRVSCQNELNDIISTNLRLIRSQRRLLQNVEFKNRENKLNILIRTSKRPKLFKECIESILSQKYTNYHIYICYDYIECYEYIKKYLNDKVSCFFVEIQSSEKYKFNLYNNLLMDEVDDGFILFMDDDDIYSHEMCFKIINENIDNTDTILIWKFMRPDKLVYPRHINNIRIGEIDTTMICFHNKYKNIARWKDSQCGDFFFYSDLFSKLKNLNIFSKKVNYIITKTNYNNKMCSSIT
jgi:glycosyltransferase involved in cell wall biosynthesis